MTYFKENEHGIISFKYKIPSLKVFSGNVCSQCDGTAINNTNNWKCYHCSETGKELIFDEKAQENFSDFGLSVYILCKLMDYCAIDYSTYADKAYRKEYLSENMSDQQTMMFQLSEDTGITQGSAWAWLHNSVIEKVFTFNDNEEKKVREAMRDTQNKLFNRKENIISFRLYANSDNKFWLEVPGSACTLGTETQSLNNWKWGKVLSPHNVDHRTAQISFLAGLTVLNEIACRKI